MIFNAFFLALGQTGDPRFRKVLGLGILLTLALLVAAYAGFIWLITWAFGTDITVPILGEVRWLNDLLSFSSIILMFLLSTFLMIPVASAITSMFLDEVAQAVEDKHYPLLPPARNVPFGEALKDTVNFLGVLIGANIIALIVASVMLIFFPPGWAIVFYGLNGYLLGREYITLAATRRIGRDGAKRLFRDNRGTVWLAGTLMALPLSIPLLNLVIPILGAATFTHIFHALNEGAEV